MNARPSQAAAAALVGPDRRAAARLRGRDFLDLAQLDQPELIAILELAGRFKAGEPPGPRLRGRSLGLIFQKPSVRTRVSFEVAIYRLGGQAIVLQDQEVGLGRRESTADVARALERYVDGLVARLNAHDDLEALAAAASCPVVNALTDVSHPCQVLADLLTIRERLGRLDGSAKVVFVGDGNNVVQSLMEASSLLGFALTVVSPPAYRPGIAALARAPKVAVTGDLSAVEGADVVYTDVWTSMGRETESDLRRAQFAEYQVDEELLELAPRAWFMHCLPAHRGEEVSAGVMDGPRSIVFDQAENRLWTQMALLALIFAPTPGGEG
ncbi:MAG: ornithine carbamoyltransferase [Candidatus Dormibacteraeota bacterium]|nr:ornithine carbamoyltransferase [Candidatus Dormibacteraeota bacterium]